MRKISFVKLSFLVLCSLFCAGFVEAQSVFTYQGKLNDAGVPASGNYDFTFKLFSVVSGGSQIGADVLRDDVQVTNGVFTVNLDFGASPFTSATANYLEILVRPGASTGAYTLLAPRLAITNSPYSIKSLNADNATNATNATTATTAINATNATNATTAVNATTATTATNALQLGGVTANQYVLTTDSRMTDARNPLPNSTNYIQNTTSLQSTSNFNISGNGLIGGRLGIGTIAPSFKVEVIDSSNTGLRVQTNTVGGTVASFGGNGAFNIDASGQPGGRLTVLENGRVGIGTVPPIYRLDVFDQSNAGFRVRTNISGGTVASFGGFGNFLIDSTATSGGRFSVLENGSVGIGTNSPTYKLYVSDSSNAGFRVQTDTAGGTVAAFGRFGLFSIDSVGATSGRLSVLENGNIGIGVPNPTQKLSISGAGIVRALVNSDSNAGFALGLSNLPKWSVATVTGGNFQIYNDAIGANAFWIDSTSNNVGIGTISPTAKLSIDGGSGRGLVVTTNNSGDFVAQFGSVGVFAIDNASVGGGRLRINENGNMRINNPIGLGVITGNTEMLTVNGYVRAFMPPLGIGIPVCQEAATSTLVLCAVSSRRYKKNIQNFNEGLSLISRLRPVSFNWKANDQEDFGLIAEDVAEVAPLLTYYNANGEVEGVKYDRVGVVLVNAVKEQQEQIEAQQKQIDEQNKLIEKQSETLTQQKSELEKQRSELAELKKFVCSTNLAAEICQPKKSF